MGRKSNFVLGRGPRKITDRLGLTAAIELLPAIEQERVEVAREDGLLLSRHDVVSLLLKEALDARHRRRVQPIAAE